MRTPLIFIRVLIMGIVYAILPFLIAIITFITAFLSEGKYRAILLYSISALAIIIAADLSIIPYTSGVMSISSYNITTPSGIIGIGAHNLTTIKPIIPGNLLLIYMMPAALFAIICVILAFMEAINIRPKAKLMG